MSLLDCQPKDPEMMAAMEEQLEARLQKAGRELIERDRARYLLFLFFFNTRRCVNGERDFRFFFFMEGAITFAERSLAATTKKIDQIRRAFSRHDKTMHKSSKTHTERQRERRMKREELRKPRRTTMWTSIRSIAIRKKS